MDASKLSVAVPRLPGDARLWRYAVALLAVALAWLARERFLPEATERSPFVAFGLAILITSLISGFGPGLLATAASSLIAVLFYLPPYVALEVHAPVDAALLVLFAAEGLVAALAGGVVRRSLQRQPRPSPSTTDRYLWFLERADALRGDLGPSSAPLIDPLTPRELETARLLALGLSNDEIADAMFISMNTTKTHLKRIYGKLGARTRTEAVARCIELSLFEAPAAGDVSQYLDTRRARGDSDRTDEVNDNHPRG